MQQRSPLRADIDGLRALAVLAVLAFVCTARWLPGEFVGIDVLFTVSGYLITSTVVADLDRGAFDLLGFYRRRLQRLLPALLVVLAAAFVVGWFLLFAGEYRRLGAEMAVSAAFVTNFFPLSGRGIADIRILDHLWCVAILVQFCFAWPILLMLSHRRRAVATAIVFVLVPSFLACLYLSRHDLPTAFGSPLSRAWEFMIGAGLAELQRRGWRWHAAGARTAVLTGTVMLAAGFVLMDTKWLYPAGLPLVPCLAAALILSAGSETWLNRRVFANGMLVAVGSICYPLYLWYWPLLAFTTIAESEVPSSDMRFGMLAVAFAAAIATHLLIERPIRHRSCTNARAASLVALAFAIGTAGVACFALKGLPGTGFRDPARQSFLDSLASPRQSAGCTDACTVRDPARRHAVLLWGDQHAAALYAGLEKNLPSDWQILQVTHPDCAPDVSVDAPSTAGSCRQSNWQALQIIVAAKPDVVIVTQDHGQRPRLYEAMAARLKQLGVTRTLLAGPTPHWTTGLPTIVARHLWPVPPRRTWVGFDPQFQRIDQALAVRLLTSDSMAFVDIVDTFCNDAGCLTYLGEDRRPA